MLRISVFLAIGLSVPSFGAHAGEPRPGLSFMHNDWELACDNTRSCRAAGYQKDDGDAPPMSVLLARKAGPRAPVTGELMLGQADEEADGPGKKVAITTLRMRINDRDLGPVVLRNNTGTARLSDQQVAALLAALVRTSTIEWGAGGQRWVLSDQGAAAVLLKMDEFQGRIGTPGALVKKGRRPEDGVLPPLPAPVVHAAPLVKTRPGDQKLVKDHTKDLIAAFDATLESDDDICPKLGSEEDTLSVTRLTETKLLVSGACWMAAYNFGQGYWVINDKPPFDPVLVTTSGSEDSNGQIFASHKGRGLGDCWSSAEWTWDGKQFVKTVEATTGMCRMVAAGGAWSLPTVTTEVRPARR